jgi:hypothetical protein
MHPRVIGGCGSKRWSAHSAVDSKWCGTMRVSCTGVRKHCPPPPPHHTPTQIQAREGALTSSDSAGCCLPTGHTLCELIPVQCAGIAPCPRLTDSVLPPLHERCFGLRGQTQDKAAAPSCTCDHICVRKCLIEKSCFVKTVYQFLRLVKVH